jgi:HAD superfamily hydrolase (TIGR01509 family)
VPPPSAPFGVVFDLDGLLVDSEPLQERAIGAVLARYGVHLTAADFVSMVGISTPRNFEDVLARRGPFASLERLLAQKHALYREIATAELRPMPGAVALVEAAAAAGVPRAVASSSPRADVDLSLAAVGLDGLLPLRVGGDEVQATKPAPDLYLRALDLLGLPAARCVGLEDTAHGVHAAKAAGLACVAVPNRQTCGQDLSVADRRVSSLEALTLRDLASLVPIR